MHHIGTITKSSRLPNLPFHAQCSCGTAGTFPEKEQAVTYLTGHGQNVKANSMVNTFELVDKADEPEVLPNTPSTHVPGVGNMPASHAALADQQGPFGTDALATSEPAQPATEATDWSQPENWKKNRKKK
jgi:hypothetical protein